MPSSGGIGIVHSIALGSFPQCGKQSSIPAPRTGEHLWSSTKHSLGHALFCAPQALAGQCRARAALSDSDRSTLCCWQSWAIVLHGKPRMLKALLLSLADLEEGKRYPRINPPFLLPLLSSEIGGFEVRGNWSSA